MEKVKEEGNVVKDFYIGNTHIQICDDYCRDKTPEETQQILDKIARDAARVLRAAAINKDKTA